MTCVVALKDKGKIWMGADSAGVNDYFITARADPKIYKVGDMLIGFTTSFRMGQLLGYNLHLPDHDPRDSDIKYMSVTFVDACRNCLKDGGWAVKENEREGGGVFLVAYRGEIYVIDGDYHVGVQCEPYFAVGCGRDLAMGSLYSTLKLNMDAKDKVLIALEAATKYSAGVCAPYMVESI